MIFRTFLIFWYSLNKLSRLFISFYLAQQMTISLPDEYCSSMYMTIDYKKSHFWFLGMDSICKSAGKTFNASIYEAMTAPNDDQNVTTEELSMALNLTTFGE